MKFVKHYKAIIQELELTFPGGGTETSGFIFNQKVKTDYGYIYEVNDEDNIHYEVFERVVSNRYNFETKKSIEGEFIVSYPKANVFGYWAWTTRDYERAIKILKEIELRVKFREANKEDAQQQTQPQAIQGAFEETSSSVGPE
jgi:hypothetical protein